MEKFSTKTKSASIEVFKVTTLRIDRTLFSVFWLKTLLFWTVQSLIISSCALFCLLSSHLSYIGIKLYLYMFPCDIQWNIFRVIHCSLKSCQFLYCVVCLVQCPGSSDGTHWSLVSPFQFFMLGILCWSRACGCKNTLMPLALVFSTPQLPLSSISPRDTASYRI